MVIKQLIYPLIIGVSLLSLNGCTAIGFGIGALSDADKTMSHKIANKLPSNIPKNCRLQIFLKNGQCQDGEFVTLINQKEGGKYVEAILFYDKPSNRHVSARISEIDSIVTRSRGNGKWKGLIIGGIIDTIILAGVLKMDRLFEGFAFFQ